MVLMCVCVCGWGVLFVFLGDPEKAWAGQLHLLVPHQTCAENHQVPAAA